MSQSIERKDSKIRNEESRGEFIVEVENALRKELKRSTQRHRPRKKFTIFRAPVSLRSQDDLAFYEPKIVSIGPYHRGKPNLSAMEDHKIHFLRRFLRRNRDRTLKDYVTKMEELEGRARSCYSEEIMMDSKEFVQMLLLDGCFILERLLTVHDDAIELDDFPIIGTVWTSPYVDFDLLKLENQVPFFILQHLFDMHLPHDSSEANRLSLFKRILSTKQAFFKSSRIPSEEFVPDHLLHFFLESIIPANSTTDGKQYPKCHPSTSPKFRSILTVCCCFLLLVFRRHDTTSYSKTARTVVELLEAGVKFKIKDNGNLLHVKFSNGVVEMSPLYLTDSTAPHIRNFMALEQCNKKYGCHFTSYAAFMDALVDTPADVAELEQKGLLINFLGSNEDAAKLFNQLCIGIVLDGEGGCLNNVRADIRQYCSSKWPKWRAKLSRDYFSNPWTMISLLAAMTLLLLTITQTVFAILERMGPNG